MKPIGGFFGIELPDGKSAYHSDAIPLNTARACIRFIINQEHPTRIYLPYYTCNASLAAFEGTETAYAFYALEKDLTMQSLPVLLPGELIIYINYFGLKGRYIEQLLDTYGDRLIVDNSQAFFEKRYRQGWSFNSARKFFGVPDGGFLYAPARYDYKKLERFDDFHFSHLINRFTGKQQQAYLEFVAYEDSLSPEIKRMSLFSEALLSNVDYQQAAVRRKENYQLYAASFDAINLFAFTVSEEAVPMAYPLLVDVEIERTALFRQQIFIPTLWADTYNRNCAGFDWEKELSKKLLPLPVDHRYDANDCRRVIAAVNRLINQTDDAKSKAS